MPEHPFFEDEIRSDFIYGDHEIGERILRFCERKMESVQSLYFRDALTSFTDPPASLVSKIASVLEPESEFFDLVVHGEERQGKTPAFLMMILVALSFPIQQMYIDQGLELRIALFTGPNVTTPEIDMIEKFQTHLSHIASVNAATGRVHLLMEKIANGATNQVYVFGDSSNRADLFIRILDDPDMSHIRWFVAMDESDHLHGRGYAPKSTTEYGHAEANIRSIGTHPHVVGRAHISATLHAIYTISNDRVLHEEKKTQVLLVAPTDNYYGIDHLDVRYPMLETSKITDYERNGIHDCLDDFWRFPISLEGRTNHGEPITLHPVMLLILTRAVQKSGDGMNAMARDMSDGEYSSTNAHPICLVFAGPTPTVFVDGVAYNSVEILCHYYPDLTQSNASARVRKANHIQSILPCVVRRFGTRRRIVLFGYNKLARNLTVSCRFESPGEAFDRFYYISHICYKIRKLKGNEYPICIEDIRQVCARSFLNSYDVSLDDVYEKYRQTPFEIVACTLACVKDDIIISKRFNRLMSEVLALTNDIEEAWTLLDGKLPQDQFQASSYLTTTKRKKSINEENRRLINPNIRHQSSTSFDFNSVTDASHVSEVIADSDEDPHTDGSDDSWCLIGTPQDFGEAFATYESRLRKWSRGVNVPYRGLVTEIIDVPERVVDPATVRGMVLRNEGAASFSDAKLSVITWIRQKLGDPTAAIRFFYRHGNGGYQVDRLPLDGTDPKAVRCYMDFCTMKLVLYLDGRHLRSYYDPGVYSYHITDGHCQSFAIPPRGMLHHLLFYSTTTASLNLFSCPEPDLPPLPTREYRAQFDADLLAASLIEPSEWDTMHLSAIQNQKAGRIYWKIVCHTFIEDAKVIRRYRPVVIEDRAARSNFCEKLCSFRPGSYANTWRSFSGGCHMRKEHDGTFSLSW